MADKSGGRAFPTHDNAFDGMSLRDWFAGQALIMAGCYLVNDDGKQFGNIATAQEIAVNAYRLADAMIAERAKERS